MEYHKFKKGDKVRTIGDTGARVVSSSTKVVHNSDGTIDRTNMVEVEITEGFRDKELVTYEEKTLTFDVKQYQERKQNVVIQDKCPKCGSEWHVSGFTKEWKDCLKCGKRAEDLCMTAEETIDSRVIVEEFNMADLFDQVYGNSSRMVYPLPSLIKFP